jgi:hypothetical protein
MSLGWRIFWIVAIAATVGIVVFFEMIVVGLGTQASEKYGWLQERVLLGAYGPPDAYTGLPNCVALPAPEPADGRRLNLACETGIVERVSQDFDDPRICKPVTRERQPLFRLPFAEQAVEYFYFAAGRNKAAELPATLEAARALGRREFGQRFLPGFSDQSRGFEMLVHDEPEPVVDAIDCGDYSIVRILTRVRNP